MRFGNAILLLIVMSFTGYSAPFILLDSIQLAKAKQMIHDGTASSRTMLAYKDLLLEADGLLSIRNPTVVDKTIEPPTGNKHDYLSIGRYWWPDPEVSDGLPWIRKDGVTNPDTQTAAVDRKRLGAMIQGVRTLSLAFYFSEVDKYAEKATNMLRTWFVDESTRMNPHMEYGQSIPGYSEGRPYGILDARAIASTVPDAIKMLSISEWWTESIDQKLRTWLADYLKWLTQSKLGKAGSKLENNHGSWYSFQVAALALYLGDESLVRKVVEKVRESLEHQLDVDGGQVHELARTKSFFYSCFNLEAVTNIATIGSKVDLDMWNFESDGHKSLSLAIDYLTPVIEGERWSHPSQKGPDVSKLVPLLIKFSTNTESKKYELLLKKTISILVEKEKATGQKNSVLQELSLISVSSF